MNWSRVEKEEEEFLERILSASEEELELLLKEDRERVAKETAEWRKAHRV